MLTLNMLKMTFPRKKCQKKLGIKPMMMTFLRLESILILKYSESFPYTDTGYKSADFLFKGYDSYFEVKCSTFKS